MYYEMEQLLPIVAKLTQQYTSGESTSVTYERARYIMEAVLYSINMCSEESAVVLHGMTVNEIYKTGCEIITVKIQQTKNMYSDMIKGFRHYGNTNLKDTVEKAIPGFFMYYDGKFAPQETIITMDYPVFNHPTGITGIIAIEQYIKALSLEQKFMGGFQEEYVREILKRFHVNYRSQYFNLCRIFLRHVACCVITKRITDYERKDYICTDRYSELKKYVEDLSKEELKKNIEIVIESIVKKKLNHDLELEKYLKLDVCDFVMELKMGVENNCLEQVVIL